MSNLSDMIEATVERIFADHLDDSLRRKVEAGDWPEKLWQALDDAGLLDALAGGEGGRFSGLGDACTVLRSAGGHAIPAPVTETMVARWIAGACGLEQEEGVVAVLPTRPDTRLTAQHKGGTLVLEGSEQRVPWLSTATSAVVLAETDKGPVAALVNITEKMRKYRKSIASEPLSSVCLDGVAAQQWVDLPKGDIVACEDAPRMLALLRSMMMVGAAERIVSMSVAYSADRQQFGRPISKFQAVQQNLSVLAAETAACAAITDAAVSEIMRRGEWTGLADAACARIRLMSDEIARITHQVHGAIGFTQEYALHDLTRRLFAWRDDYGYGNDWAQRLGAQALSVERHALWPLVTSL
jgi:Acyl-CoA dehydrogenases